MAVRGFLNELRDRIVHRSQMGKEKLDATFARRALDKIFMELGERYYEIASRGEVAVPEDLRDLMRKVDSLAKRVAAHREQLKRLEDEATTPS